MEDLLLESVDLLNLGDSFFTTLQAMMDLIICLCRPATVPVPDLPNDLLLNQYHVLIRSRLSEIHHTLRLFPCQPSQLIFLTY